MFTRARIKLTAFYILTIGLVVGIFSLILFQYTVQHIQDNISEEDGNSAQVERVFAEQTIDQIQYSLIIGDTIVILVAGILSYFLAGWTLKPIKVALDAQEQFSAQASHELRTPLAVMKSENEVFLKKMRSPEEGKRLAESNLEEVNRMTGMVENLLMLARSKTGEIDFEKSPVDISEAVSHVLSKLGGAIENKNLALTNDLPQGVMVEGNKKLLEQVFFNIIQNAITYTDSGSLAVMAAIENKVVVTIRDTGKGIAPHDLPNIFKPFYRADSSRSASTGGVGLGLSVVYEIVRMHQGAVIALSEVGKGTTIKVSLPLAKIEKLS